MAEISIIIPVYNAEKYLRQCLDSVVNQTFKDIEIICVNDGSIDNSHLILQEYANNDKRIRVFTQENSGPAKARNNGFDLATGKYVYFLDSDDYIQSDILEKLYNQSEKEKADICICNFNYYYEDTLETNVPEWTFRASVCPLECFSAIDIPDNILQVCAPNLLIKLYNKDFLKKCNFSFQNLKSCNDVFFDRATLILADRITYVDEILATYRTNRQGSISSERGRSVICLILAYRYLKEFLEKHKKFYLIKNSYYASLKDNGIYEFINSDLNGRILLTKNLHKMLSYSCFQNLLNILKIEYNNYLGNFLTILELGTNKIYLVNFKQLIQNIFSIKNETCGNKKHKVITVCGMRIKLERN